MLKRHRFRAAAALLLILATLPHLGTLDDGFFLDDVVIYGQLKLAHAGHPEARWWDLYFLGDYDERLRFSGHLPWWAAEGLQWHFFRPLAAASHYLDVLLWPESPTLMHAHNLAWFIGTGAAVAWLFRAALKTNREALLALAVFMLASMHEWPVQWLAARNGQMTLLFGVLSIMGFRRWNDGWRWRALAALALLLSLLSSELGVSVFAFVLGRALTRRPEETKARLAQLALALTVIVGWRTAYVTAGFGAIGSGTYVDPLSAPLAFLQVAPERLGLMALALAGPLELLFHPSVALGWRIVLAGLGLTAMLLVLRALRHRDLWPWAIASALCMLPLASSVPQPRLLGFVLLGWAPIAARAISEAWDRGGAHRAIALTIGLHHFGLGPLVVTGALDGLRPAEFADLGEPGANLGDLEGRNLILINPPTYASAKMVGAVRHTRGLSMPAFAWALGVGENLEVTREGCCTIVIESPEGLFRERWAAMYRGPQVPFVEGEVVKTLAFEATIRAVTRDGYAKAVAFEMTGPLRKKQFVLARWNGEDYVVVRPREIPRS